MCNRITLKLLNGSKPNNYLTQTINENKDTYLKKGALCTYHAGVSVKADK